MFRKRDALRAELEAHTQECVSKGPHGYIVCQLARERLEERLERIERQIASSARWGQLTLLNGGQT